MISWSERCQFRTSRSQFSSSTGAAIRVPASGACAFRDRSETTEHSRVSAESSATSSRACRSVFPKSPVSRVIETSAIKHVPVRRILPMRPNPGPLAVGRQALPIQPKARRPSPAHRLEIERFISIRSRAACRAAVIRRYGPAAARLSSRDHRRRFLARQAVMLAQHRSFVFNAE